ncbi:CDGSH iron-sulfur domain-containing protein [Phormidesmis sp. 146-20]
MYLTNLVSNKLRYPSMSKATIQLDQGTHYLCTCGWSKNLPFCNGAHKGSSFQPNVVELKAPAAIELPDITNSHSSQST